MASAASVAGAARRGKGVREIVTPEGVPVRFELAGRGARIIAFGIDVAILGVSVYGIAFVIDFLVGRGLPVEAGWILMLLAAFFLRSFYFIFFELRWQGGTPGKRLLRLRVADRKGGALRADAVFARNLMREVEVFLPLTVAASLVSPGLEYWGDELVALVWAFVATMLPFFNRDRLRAGDIVGGTWVVRLPRAVLLPDVAAPAGADAGGTEHAFSAEQLAVYGIHELQTLETVLRGTGRRAKETHAAVAARIRRRIGWEEPAPADDRAFLEAFYIALRTDLEHRLTLGERRADKHHGEEPGRGRPPSR